MSIVPDIVTLKQEALDSDMTIAFELMGEWAADWPKGGINLMLEGGEVPSSAKLKHLSRMCSGVSTMPTLKDLPDEAAELGKSFATWVQSRVSPKIAEIFRTTLDEPLKKMNIVLNEAAAVIASLKAAGGDWSTPAIQSLVAGFKNSAATFDAYAKQVEQAVDGDSAQLVQFAIRFISCTCAIIEFAERIQFNMSKIAVKVDVGIVLAFLFRSHNALKVWRKAVKDPGMLPSTLFDVSIAYELDALDDVLRSCEVSFLGSWTAEIEDCCKAPRSLPILSLYKGPECRVSHVLVRV